MLGRLSRDQVAVLAALVVPVAVAAILSHPVDQS